MPDTMADYLKIRAVSAGVLRTLIEECPAAAMYCSTFSEEPKPADDTDASDFGSVVHSILFEGSTDCVVVVDPEEHPAEKTGAIPAGWTNKSIRAARDQIRLLNKIPVLKKDFASIAAAVASAQRFIESLNGTDAHRVWAAFQPGCAKREETIEFQWHGMSCKIRPDLLSNDGRTIVDGKSTMTSANPEAWARSQMYGRGLYLSAAFYQVGVEITIGTRPEYLFLVISQEAPYLCSLVGVDPHGMDLAHRQIEWAIKEWIRCAKAGKWPGYPNNICYIETPAWLESQWTDREMGQL